MATVKVKFRASMKENKEGVLYYQVIHERVIRQIKTDGKLFGSEWDGMQSEVIIPFNSNRRTTYLIMLNDRIKFGKKRIEQIIKARDGEGCDYTVDDIVSDYETKPNGKSLFSFIAEIIMKLKEMGKIRTAETYISTMNSFVGFSKGADIALKSINSDMLERYEAYLNSRDSSLNTISFYMRTLRAIYNRAVESGYVKQENPFKRVYTSIDKTAKRAIPLQDITKIKELELLHKPDLELARDVFLFSFYTRGMSFIDIAYLRKKDIKNGELTYRRRKTGQTLHIKWEKCMAELAQRHPNDNTEYLLPIITDPERCSRKQYIEKMAKINSSLKKIATMAGISSNLTLYVARHSWASAARTKNIPISVISEGMGHDNELTTQIYLASLDTAIVDKANRLILKSI